MTTILVLALAAAALCGKTLAGPVPEPIQRQSHPDISIHPYSGYFGLAASNPLDPVLDDQPVTACGNSLWVGGATCSYCTTILDPSDCPPGNVTTLDADSDGSVRGMAVQVPGGQQLYFDSDWSVGYTVAHSMGIPPGGLPAELLALGGSDGALWDTTVPKRRADWAACPGDSQSGSKWKVFGRNGTGGPELGPGCVSIALLVREEEQAGAWQYS